MTQRSRTRAPSRTRPPPPLRRRCISKAYRAQPPFVSMQLGLGSLPLQRFAVQRCQTLRSPAVPSSARVPAQRPRQHAVRLRATGGEGADAVTGRPSPPSPSPDAVIKTAREMQLSASELMVRARALVCVRALIVGQRSVDKQSVAETQAEFLQAEDLQDAVSKRVSLLDEAFFTTASTYIALARRDGQPLVEKALTEVLRVAAAAKDATLRPEIRLLNALMRATTPAERELLYQQQASSLTRRARLHSILATVPALRVLTRRPHPAVTMPTSLPC